MLLDLLRSHVGNRAHHLLHALRSGAISDSGDAKVTEQDLASPPQQHVLGLDIAVDELFLVGVLQGIGHLLDVVHDQREGEPRAFGMTLA